nr:Ycf2 [Hymenophyllum coreanum]
MKKENKLREVRGRRVRDVSSLSKILGLAKIDSFHSLFTSLKNRNSIRLLISIFYGSEPFIKLFDLRILNPLLLRDLRDLIKLDNRFALGILMVLTISMSMYHSSKKDLIKRSENVLINNLYLKKGTIFLNNLKRIVGFVSSTELLMREQGMSHLANKILLNTYLIKERSNYSIFFNIKRIFSLWEINRYLQHSHFTFNSLLLIGRPLLPHTTGLLKDESNGYIYFFQKNKNYKLFFNLLRFDSHENQKESSIPYNYSRIRHGLLNLLIRLIGVINRLNPIPNKITSNDYINNGESWKAIIFERNLFSVNGTFCKELEISGSQYFDSNNTLLNDFRIFIDKPRELTSKETISIFWSQLKKEYNESSISYLVQLYEQNKIISFYLIYLHFLYDYLCTVANKYLLEIKYRFINWAEDNRSITRARFATERELFDWKEDINYLLTKILILQIDEHISPELVLYKLFNIFKDPSPSSFGRILMEIASDFDRSIYDISLVRNKLLNYIGISMSNTNSKYSPKFINLSFLHQVIIPDIISRDVLINMVDSFVYKLNNIDSVFLDSLLSLINIDKDLSFFNKILRKKDSILIESKFRMDEELIASSIFLEPSENQFMIEPSWIEDTQNGFWGNVSFVTGRQNWNPFLDDLSYLIDSKRNGIESRHASDQVNRLDLINNINSPVLSCSERDYISRIKMKSYIGNCSNSYSNIVDNLCMGFENNKVMVFFLPRTFDKYIIPAIQFQVSNSLLPKLSQQIEERDIDYTLPTIESSPSNFNKSAIALSNSCRFYDSILQLGRSPTELYSSFQKTKRFPILSCSNYTNCLEETLKYLGIPANWQTQVHYRNLGFDGFILERFIDEESNLLNESIKNQYYQNISNIVSLCESEEYEMLYWLRRFSLHNSIASRFLATSKFLHENTEFENTYISDEPIRTSYIIDFNELFKDLKRYNLCWIFSIDSISNNWSLFGEYIPWFFTPNWWRYFYDLIIKTYPEIMLNVSDQFNLNFSRIDERIAEETNKIRAYLLSSLRLIFKSDLINSMLARFDLFLLKEITNQRDITHLRWSIVRSLKKPILFYPLVSILMILFFLKHYLSTVLGFNLFHLWDRFNTIRYLTDPMRGFYFKKVMYSPSTREMKTKRLLINSLKIFLNYISNIFFYFFVKSRLDFWIFQKSSPDILRIKTELLTQHFVTNNTISKYGTENFDSNLLKNHIIGESLTQTQEGSNLLSYLPQFCQKDLLNYKTCNLDPAEKWVLSALEKNILFSSIVKQKGILNVPCRDIPISFQSGLIPSKGISLVGPIETGRSFIIRDIASNSYFPLIKLPLRRLLYNKSFFTSIRGKFISRQSVHRLNLIFAIAKQMSPCTIWIQDIHELNVHRLYHRLEANPGFLLCLTLRSISYERKTSCIRNNLVIASTHVPSKVDPALIASNRLNQLINFRRSNKRQRREDLSILLRVKGFEIESNSSFLEGIDYLTMGYSKRDLSCFVNGTLLINTSRKSRRVIYNDTIELALHRQNSIVTCIGNGNRFNSEYRILLYKIGKSVLKNDWIRNPSTDILFINDNKLKKRFYYLYNWYLEPSITESTIKEFTIFPYILVPLAGLAARDCCKMDIKNEENPILIDKIEENDFNLACGILEILSKNFLCSEIGRSASQKNSLPFVSLIDRSFYSNIICPSYSSRFAKRGVSNDLKIKQSSKTDSITKEVLREIAWSPKVWHFSFQRSSSFESIRLLSESNSLDNLILFYRNQDQIPQRDFELNKFKYSENNLYKEKGYLFGYNRSLGVVRKREIIRLENQLDNILLRERFLGLGFSDSYNQYETQLNQSHEPILFLGKRFVWDPTRSVYSDSSSPFLYRNLLAQQELVRRLYITYGIRREREKHFPNQREKDFFLYRGYDRKSITDLSNKQSNNFSLSKELNFEYIREVQSMYINLQYPQLFVPIHLYQAILLEDLQERFIRFRLLSYKDRWIKSSCFPSKYFLTYNMLFESYQYLIHLFRSNRMSLYRTDNQLLIKDPIESKFFNSI